MGDSFILETYEDRVAFVCDVARKDVNLVGFRERNLSTKLF